MHSTKAVFCVFLVLIILNFSFNTPISSAQEKSICPDMYSTKGIPLHEQYLSESEVISTLVCTYSEQSASEIRFEITWSPNGKVYGDKWCQNQFVIENGIGTFKSDTHYVNIVSSGILPWNYDNAKDFTKLLFEKVKPYASSCYFKIENEKEIFQMKENVTKNEPHTKINTTVMEQKTEKNSDIKQINKMQFPIMKSFVFSGIVGVGYLILKKHYKKQ